MELKEIYGLSVILRPLDEKYFDAYLKAFSAKIRSLIHASSLEAERVYLQERLAKQQEGKTFFYSVFDAATKILIGAIEIRDPTQHPGQLYCWLNETYWGAGRFAQAIDLAAAEYFAITGRQSFTAHVDVTNKRSYHALKKVGFADSGIIEGPHGKQYELILRKEVL